MSLTLHFSRLRKGEESSPLNLNDYYTTARTSRTVVVRAGCKAILPTNTHLFPSGVNVVVAMPTQELTDKGLNANLLILEQDQEVALPVQNFSTKAISVRKGTPLANLFVLAAERVKVDVV